MSEWACLLMMTIRQVGQSGNLACRIFLCIFIPEPVYTTKVCIFVGKKVSEVRPDGEGKPRSGATKKRKISRTSLLINLHF